MNETPVTAGEWPEPGERVRRLREAVRLMKKLWTEDYVSFEGKYYKTREAKIFDKPAGGVPLYIAGAGPQVAEFAGKEADGFICTSGKGAELYRDTLLPALDKGARDAGRDPSKIERMIEMKVSYDTDRERAMNDTKEWSALALAGGGQGRRGGPARDGEAREGRRGQGAHALHRLDGSRRARREDPPVRRVGLHAPGLPLPGSGSGTCDAPLREGHPPAPASVIDLDAAARALLDSARVAHLATADQYARPHVVPIVFVLDGDRLYFPLDRKPKREDDWHMLRRVRNIETNGRTSIVVDRYEEDWTKLAWVLLEGVASDPRDRRRARCGGGGARP